MRATGSAAAGEMFPAARPCLRRADPTPAASAGVRAWWGRRRDDVR